MGRYGCLMEMGSQRSGGEKLRLKVVAGNATGTVIEVERELEIGRQAGGEGTLAEDIEISRRHARIAGDADGRFTVEDLGSTNGTYVNGRRVEGPTILETGDRIELGASALVVQVSTTQPTPPSSDTIAPLPGGPETEAAAEPAAVLGGSEAAPAPGEAEAEAEGAAAHVEPGGAPPAADPKGAPTGAEPPPPHRRSRCGSRWIRRRARDSVPRRVLRRGGSRVRGRALAHPLSLPRALRG